jgi:regulatory associated protein of mTOR
MFQALCEWDRGIYSFKLPTPTTKMVFHQYDPHLAVCDEGSTIRLVMIPVCFCCWFTRLPFSIWDWRRRAIVAAFNNGNPSGTSITSLSFVNEDTGGLLLAGSADGMVRLYRNYDPVYGDGRLELVSAWRALNIMTKVTRRAGLITDWNQNLARLLVGGDSDNINCWDAVRECVVFVSLTTIKILSSAHSLYRKPARMHPVQ